MTKTAQNPLLEISNLHIEYPTYGNYGMRRQIKPAVANVSFKIFPGECYAIIGESGCGKSSIIETILGFVRPRKGTVIFEGRDLLKLSARDLRKLRPRIQPVFQDYNQALNPRMRIQDILQEIIAQLNRDLQPDGLLASVGLNPEILQHYPHQLSGGQKQRVVLARAISTRPRLLLLDEPVTSQDLSVAVQIIGLLKSLRKTEKLTFLLVSHNLSLVRLLADRVAIMQNGHFIEEKPLDIRQNTGPRPDTAFTGYFLYLEKGGNSCGYR